MKAFTLISLAFSISALVGCAGQEKTLLEERARYEEAAPDLKMGGAGEVRYVPTRVPEKVVIGWLHAHELPTKDYFWGSWLSILVSAESWEVVKLPPAKGTHFRTRKEAPKGRAP